MPRFVAELLIKEAGGSQAAAALQSVGAGARQAGPAVEKLIRELTGLEISIKKIEGLSDKAFAGLSRTGQLNAISSAQSALVAGLRETAQELTKELALERQGAEVAAQYRKERERLAQTVTAGLDPETRLGQAYLTQLRVLDDLKARILAVKTAREQGEREAREAAEAEEALQKAVAKTVVGLQAENASFLRLLAAKRQGPEALARQRVEEEALARVRQLGIGIASKEAQQIMAEIRLRHQLTQALNAQDAAQDSLSAGLLGLGRNLLSETAAALGFGGAIFATVEFLRGAARESIEAEKAMAQLRAGVLSTGGAAGFSAEQLDVMASRLSKLTGIDDEVIASGEALLLTFRRIQGEAFEPTMQAALDLSARFGKDLNDSVVMIAKALEDPIKGLTSLGRAGVQFSASQKELIKDLVASGRLLEAQKLILRELETQFGGSAVAARDTMGGALQALGVAWGNLQETVGQSGASIRVVIEGLTEAVNTFALGWQVLSIGADVAMAAIIRTLGSLEVALASVWAEMAKLSARGTSLNPFASDETKNKANLLAIQAQIDAVNKRIAVEEKAAKFEASAYAGVAKLLGIVPGLAGAYREVEDAVGGLTDAQKKALAAVEETIRGLIRQTLAAADLLQAARMGAKAYDEALLKQKVAAAILKEENRLRAVGLSLTQATRIAIETNVRAQEGLTRATDLAVAAMQRLSKAVAPGSLGTLELFDLEAVRRQILFLASELNDEKLRQRIALTIPVLVNDKEKLNDLLKAVQDLVKAQGDAAEGFRAYNEEIENAASEFLKQRAADLRGIWSDLGAYMRDSILDNLAAAAAGADVHWKDMWRSFIQTAIQALSDWLALYLATLAKAKAAEAALGSGTPGGGAGGGGWMNWIGKFMGGAKGGYGYMYGSGASTGALGADAAILDSASGGAGGGGFLSSGAGAVSSGGYAYASYGTALAAIAAWVAVIAALANQVKTSGRAEVDTTLRFGGSAGIGIDEELSRYNRQGGLARYKAQMKAMQEMVRTVVSFIQNLGGEIDRFSETSSTLTVGREGQGKRTNWFVRYADGLVKHFGKDMEAAMDFAMVQAIRSAPTIGLSPEIAQAIQASAAETMQGLQKDIDTAKTVLRARLGEVGYQLVEIFNKWAAEIRAAEELGLAIDHMIAARDREIAALQYHYLGVSTATADFLRDLASYQAGIGEAGSNMRAQIERQIAAAQAEIERLLAEGPGTVELPNGGTRSRTNAAWEAEIAKLEEQVARYIAELEKIPKALTDQELNMSIFSALYKYLEGNSKYAKEAHKYAQLRVEYEFAIIKAQLVALGKWEEFAQMYDDAYRAARAAAGKEGRRGGGGNRQDSRQSALDQLSGWRAAAQGEVAQAVHAYTLALRDWNEAAKEGKLTAEQRAEGERLLREEMQRGLRARAEELAGIGTDFTRQIDAGRKYFEDLRKQGRAQTGMPDWLVDLLEGKFFARMEQQFQQALNEFNGFTDPFLQIQIQADALRQGLEKLAASAGWTDAQKAAANAAIDVGVQFQKEKAVLGIFGQIYEYLKDSPAYAGQILAFKRKELELQFKIIQAQLTAAGMWNDENKKLLDDARKAAEDALGGITTVKKVLRFASDYAIRGPNGELPSGGEDPANALDEAKRLLEQYQRNGLGEFWGRISDINSDFEKIKAAYGETPEVLGLYADAIRGVVRDFVSGVTGKIAELNQSDLSPFTNAQKYALAFADFAEAQAKFAAGDLSVVGTAPELVQTLLQAAQAAGIVGEGYRGIFTDANLFLRGIQGWAEAFAPGALAPPPQVPGVPFPGALPVPVAPPAPNAGQTEVVAAIRELKTEVARVATNTDKTATHTRETRDVVRDVDSTLRDEFNLLRRVS